MEYSFDKEAPTTIALLPGGLTAHVGALGVGTITTEILTPSSFIGASAGALSATSLALPSTLPSVWQGMQEIHRRRSELNTTTYEEVCRLIKEIPLADLRGGVRFEVITALFAHAHTCPAAAQHMAAKEFSARRPSGLVTPYTTDLSDTSHPPELALHTMLATGNAPAPATKPEDGLYAPAAIRFTDGSLHTDGASTPTGRVGGLDHLAQNTLIENNLDPSDTPPQAVIISPYPQADFLRALPVLSGNRGIIEALRRAFGPRIAIIAPRDALPKEISLFTDDLSTLTNRFDAGQQSAEAFAHDPYAHLLFPEERIPLFTGYTPPLTAAAE